jgi:hypothetical protein
MMPPEKPAVMLLNTCLHLNVLIPYTTDFILSLKKPRSKDSREAKPVIHMAIVFAKIKGLQQASIISRS